MVVMIMRGNLLLIQAEQNRFSGSKNIIHLLLWHTFYSSIAAGVGHNIVYRAMPAMVYEHVDKWQQSITSKEGLFLFYHATGTNKYEGIP